MKPRGGEGQNGRLKCPMGFLVIIMINRITRNYKINMDGEVRQKIFRIFNSINDITPKLNNGRKRMADIKFLIRKILKLMGVKSYNS